MAFAVPLLAEGGLLQQRIPARISLPSSPLRTSPLSSSLTLSGITSNLLPKRRISVATPAESSHDSRPIAAAENPHKIIRDPEIYAVIMVAGRQYFVFPGRFIVTEKLKRTSEGDKIVLNRVLLVGTRRRIWVGKPLVPNTVVHAIIEEQGFYPEIIVFKFKRKTRYSRTNYHKKPNTFLRILGITGYEDSPFITLDRKPSEGVNQNMTGSEK